MSDPSVGGELAIPEGRLVRSRVGVAGALDAALARKLTGYARIEPDSLLADGEPGVLTFADGVPRAAYCGRGEGDRRGTGALAALAGPGPCSVELYELPGDALEEVHDTPEFTVPPGAPAEELADESALAERTRERAPDDAGSDGGSALESFLQDEERIAAIQEEARAEAERRAEEWGLDGELAE
ncbi:hypothetical protein B4589_009305 [Halolamina sp. CBA1230]|uniref:hypothetical protein n=1 Tax=Halolamina sp. CBA1230 TaxID=1853690 RepID=UPI0009A1D8A2|nr:hypothetical protein [Halolamina sp. CBA1230]QKY20564.1 hypothetical protein B4589_009305 [Halolamina sp. CBA1230]